MKRLNLQITGVEEEEKNHRKGIEKIFNKIIIENIASSGKEMLIQV